METTLFEVKFNNGSKFNVFCSGSVKMPYHKGDLLWVRETWSQGSIENGKHTGIRYKADDESYNVRWKPSIFMPKEAARIWLKITDIKVERLQDITEAINEGVLLHKHGIHWLNYIHEKWETTQFIYSSDTAKKSFLTLWSSINNNGIWAQTMIANPQVWVVSFEVVSKTGKPKEVKS
jgi:hypothetical protein